MLGYVEGVGWVWVAVPADGGTKPPDPNAPKPTPPIALPPTGGTPPDPNAPVVTPLPATPPVTPPAPV